MAPWTLSAPGDWQAPWQSGDLPLVVVRLAACIHLNWGPMCRRACATSAPAPCLGSAQWLWDMCTHMCTVFSAQWLWGLCAGALRDPWPCDIVGHRRRRRYHVLGLKEAYIAGSSRYGHRLTWDPEKPWSTSSLVSYFTSSLYPCLAILSLMADGRIRFHHSI